MPSRRKLPSLEAMHLGLKCYQEIRSGRAKNLKEALLTLKVKPHSAYRKIREFESLFEGAIFHKARGDRPTEAIDQEGLDEKIANVEALLAISERLTQPARLVIRVGTSLTLDRRVLASPMLTFLRERRRTHPHIDIRIVYGQPEPLRHGGLRGEYDLVLTSFPSSCLGDSRFRDDLTSLIPLDLQLICPMGHPLIQADLHQRIGMLRSETVVLLKDRDPMPVYPDIPTDANIVKVSSWEEGYGLAMQGAVTFAFKELLLPQERRLLEAIPFTEKAQQITIGLLRPKRAQNQRSPDEQNIVDDLARRIVDRLAAIQAYQADELDIISGSKWVFHQSPKNGKSQWVVGEVDLTMWSDGYLQGVHRLRDENGQPLLQPFDIVGGVRRNGPVCHILWRGHERPQATTACGPLRNSGEGETYAASFLTDADTLKNRDVVWTGVWLGQKTLSSEMALNPGIGYMLIVDKNAKMVRKLKKVSLNDIKLAELINAVNPNQRVVEVAFPPLPR